MKKYATIDEVMETLYDCIFGQPGRQDWERDPEILFCGVSMVPLWNDG